jgi:hypothetical protein
LGALSSQTTSSKFVTTASSPATTDVPPLAQNAVPAAKTKTTSTYVESCSPTPTADWTFKLKGEKTTVGWQYIPSQDFIYGSIDYLDVDTNHTKGVQECKQACRKDSNCRSISYSVADDGNFAVCQTWGGPYNASALVYGTDPFSQGVIYTAVYEVTNWVVPSELLPNAKFERGCPFPWSIGFEGAGSNYDFEPCGKNECPSGKYYFRGYGTAVTPDDFLGLVGFPAISPNNKYKFTCYVKGTAGAVALQFQTTSLKSGPIIFANATTSDWVKAELSFTGVYGGYARVGMMGDATGAVDFRVCGCDLVNKAS